MKYTSSTSKEDIAKALARMEFFEAWFKSGKTDYEACQQAWEEAQDAEA